MLMNLGFNNEFKDYDSVTIAVICSDDGSEPLIIYGFEDKEEAEDLIYEQMEIRPSDKVLIADAVHAAILTDVEE